jgi:lipopolysaccharide biosynthesis protein
VSNTALPDESKALLAPLTWQILERPNIGYDFGGYRDGIRVLQEAEVDMQMLVVLNDSIWWPLCADDTALERAETMGADVVGMIMRPYGRARSRSSVRTPHLQSYFFWFDQKAIYSKGFRQFWQDYRLSSFKYNAIRYGELRLTHALVGAGLTVAPLFKFDDLLAKLQTQSSDYLCKVLRQETLGERAFRHVDLARRAQELEASAIKDQAWRDAVFELFKQVDRRSEFHFNLRFPTVDLLGFNLLKRSSGEAKDSVHHVVRRAYLTAIEAGELPAPMPEVLAEIKERDRLGAAAVGR